MRPVAILLHLQRAAIETTVDIQDGRHTARFPTPKTCMNYLKTFPSSKLTKSQCQLYHFRSNYLPSTDRVLTGRILRTCMRLPFAPWKCCNTWVFTPFFRKILDSFISKCACGISQSHNSLGTDPGWLKRGPSFFFKC